MLSAVDHELAMDDHVVIFCEKCQRGLRVRVSYLGRKVGCNYCGHSFVARRSEDSEAALSASALTVPVQEPPSTAARDREVERLQEELVQLKAEHDDIAVKFMKANNQRVALHLRVKSLEGQLSQTMEHVRLAQDELRSRQVSEGELDRLRIENSALQDKATHALKMEEELRERTTHTLGLEQELQEQRTHSHKLEDELQERTTQAFKLGEELREQSTHALKIEEELQEQSVHAVKLEEELRRLEQQAEQRQHEFAELTALNTQLREQVEQQQHEFAELTALNTQLREQVETVTEGQARARGEEIGRLDNEVNVLRASLHAQTLENEAKLAQVVRERDQAVSESDRLQRELDLMESGLRCAREEIQGLATGFDEIAVEDTRLEEEREAVAGLRSALQSLIKEREHTLEERFAEVTDTCERLEHERSAVQARWEREREEGLAELQKLVQQLAAVRSERDHLVQTLRAIRRELAVLKNRQLSEAEVQQTRENALQTLWAEAERMQGEAELTTQALAEARNRLDAMQCEHERLLARHVEQEADWRRYAERDRAEIARLTLELAKAVAIRIGELKQGVDVRSAEGREQATVEVTPSKLPPRPQASPEQDQDAFRVALEEWVIQVQRRRDQSTADLALIDGELQSARAQLQLLHRDLALGDWGDDDDESFAYPFEGE